MNWLQRRLASLSEKQLRAGAVELCRRGLLTCTRGKPGDDNATYALGWLPLDDPEQYPEEVRDRHRRNMEKFRK